MSVSAFTERIRSLAQHHDTAASEDAYAALRRHGFSAFERLSIPTPRHEEWKYTNVTSIFDGTLVIGATDTAQRPATSGAEITRALGADAIVLHVRNGRLQQDEHSAIEGVDLYDLRAGATTDDLQFLASIAKVDDHPFVALNTAVHDSTVVIHLHRNVHLERPIHIVCSADTTKSTQLHAPRVLVVAESGSSALIVESHHTVGEHAAVCVPVTEVVVQAGAHLQHVKIVADEGQGKHVGYTAATVARDATYASHVACLAGAFTRNDLVVQLIEPSASAILNGVSVLHGSEMADNHTVVDHRAPHCRSEELYKGVYDDRSVGVFKGKIFVQPHAQKTEAYQSSHALLLSDRARMNAKPQLEIWADDVKCSHGATTGQLNEEAVFYMQARGIDRAAAKALMTYAFAAEVVERFPHEGLRSLLEQHIARKLEVSR